MDRDVEFLEKTADFFESREPGGEDMTHWANIYNAENLRRIAERLKSTPTAREALQLIADLPRPQSELQEAGHEDAFRVVESLFKEPPMIIVSEIEPDN